MIRVYIIAPALALRAGLRSLLMDDPRIQIIGEAANPDDIEAGQGEIDVVIWYPALSLDLDTLLSTLVNDGIGITAALLLIFDDPRAIEKLINLKVHAWGLLSPEASQAEIIAAIEAVNEGLAVINPNWLENLSTSQAYSDKNIGMVESLTAREIEILQLLALGLTNKQIAVRLGISAHTVKFHLSTIFGKMGTTNRTETVKLGLKKGLILL